MCLDRLESAFKAKPCKVGYKVMYEEDGGRLLCSFMQGDGEPRRQGVWLDARDARYPYVEDTIQKHAPWPNGSRIEFSYPNGWHVYHTLKAARSFLGWGCCVVKVEVDEPVAVGWQCRCKVTVARKIKIVEVLP